MKKKKLITLTLVNIKIYNNNNVKDYKKMFSLVYELFLLT